MNKLNAPRWNLDSIFSSIESPEYKSALDNYKTGMEKGLIEYGENGEIVRMKLDGGDEE